MPFIPHSEQNVKEMLQKIGIKNIDELFSEIPQDLKIHFVKEMDEVLALALAETKKKTPRKYLPGSEPPIMYA